MLPRLRRFGRFRLLTLCAALLLGACTQVTSPADALQTDLGTLAAQDLTFEVEALGVPHRAGGAHRAVRDARCSNQTCMRFDAARPGSSVVYRLTVPHAGRYAVQLRVKQGPDGGAFRLSTAEAGGFRALGQVTSLYAPQTTYTTLSFGEVAFSSAGSKRLRFVVTGNDARSAGHALMLDRVTLAATGSAPATAASGGEWTALFNGQNLDGWYTYLPSKGRNRDPQGVFKVTDGLLHILDLPNRGGRQEFGYLATRTSYRDYHLRLEYRWGDKRFAPRARLKRDSGIVYHISGGDKVWPRGAELQIQEGDTGDLWLLGGTVASTTVASTTANPKRYRAGGAPYTTRAGRFVRVAKSQTRDRRSGWNTVELIASGDTVTHLVNGAVVHRAERLRGAGGGTLDGGRIALQAEGAEIFYRNIEIKPLAAQEQERERGRTGGREVLFSGQDSSAWRPKNSGGRRWPVTNGALEVAPGTRVGQNDLRTHNTYGDFKLHLEFQVPASPKGRPEQGRGNSGVYLQGRYEVQILDSYGRTLSGKDDAGAIYGVRDARKNVSRPAGAWQSYDITFRAARYSSGKKVAPARITVVWNGTLVHQGVAVPRPTRLGAPEGPSAGPIVLQDHGKRVRYRNIWIEPLD
jgi:hypothetical protein